MIFPLALVGYHMIMANSALCNSLAIYHLVQYALVEYCSLTQGQVTESVYFKNLS